MADKRTQQNEEIEIDLRSVFLSMWQKVWWVVATSVAGAVAAFVVTLLLITPQYESSAMFYVNNNSISVGGTSVSISSGDLVTSRSLVESYIVILNTRESMDAVMDYSGVERSYKELSKMISAKAVNETEIFEVVVTSPDPVEAEKIASGIAYILPKRISSIIEGTSAKIVDAAVLPVRPSSPSYTKNTILGFLAGMLLSMGVIALQTIFDVTIRTEEDIAQVCDYPILASVPDMTVPGKGGYYSYQKQPEKKNRQDGPGQAKPALIGKDISFAAAESYRLLRTKVQFSFADENDCHVIGVSSALSGEGKSLTAMNLAYTLSQLNYKVLLMDCDMRRPTLAEKLRVRKKPGLSSYLTGQMGADELLQYCSIPGEEQAFHVIAAGECPPNPVELLSSDKMSKVLNNLRGMYDYIILDLPPVGEVSDALTVSGKVDGILLVARNGLCYRQALDDAIRQFRFVDAKILGVVLNGTEAHSGNYRRGYYSRDYEKAHTSRKNTSAEKAKKE